MVMLNQVDLSPNLLKFFFVFFLSSIMFRCYKEVKGLSNRYLFFAESGTHSLAAYFLFLFHLGAVIVGTS